jgi:hypothetical protein
MFNYCVLSGRVTTIPTLRCYGKDHPVTEFNLEIWLGKDRWGTVKVECLGRLAMAAAKHLSLCHRVAVAGCIAGAVRRQDDGTYKYELRLVASDLEPLREDPDVEPKPSGEDLLS